MKVKFCEKHKEIFVKKVTVQLSDGYGINPTELVNLIKESELCCDCKWSTTFPSLYKEGKKWVRGMII